MTKMPSLDGISIGTLTQLLGPASAEDRTLPVAGRTFRGDRSGAPDPVLRAPCPISSPSRTLTSMRVPGGALIQAVARIGRLTGTPTMARPRGGRPLRGVA